MKLAFAYVTDKRGLGLATLSALSVARAQKKPCDIHLFCYRFEWSVDDGLKRLLQSLQARIIIHDVADPLLEAHRTHGHVTTPSLLKLSAMSKLVPDYDRVVYLDNDTLVFDDLQIERIAFGSKPLAAVIDMDLSKTGWLRDTKWSDDGGSRDVPSPYFNSGVMIAESRNWRAAEFYRRYASALDRHGSECHQKIDCTAVDQCALNSTFENRWLRLPLTYNMQASAKFTRAWNNALVRHYCGTRKFSPVSYFRNDGSDVRLLNHITRCLGHRRSGWPLFHDLLFRLNAVRNYRRLAPIRRFLKGAERGSLAPETSVEPSSQRFRDTTAEAA